MCRRIAVPARRRLLPAPLARPRKLFSACISFLRILEWLPSGRRPEQHECLHRTYALDANGAVRLDAKETADTFMRRLRDHDAVGHAVRLHAARAVHRATTPVVAE